MRGGRKEKDASRLDELKEGFWSCEWQKVVSIG